MSDFMRAMATFFLLPFFILKKAILFYKELFLKILDLGNLLKIFVRKMKNIQNPTY